MFVHNCFCSPLLSSTMLCRKAQQETQTTPIWKHLLWQMRERKSKHVTICKTQHPWKMGLGCQLEWSTAIPNPRPKPLGGNPGHSTHCHHTLKAHSGERFTFTWMKFLPKSRKFSKENYCCCQDQRQTVGLTLRKGKHRGHLRVSRCYFTFDLKAQEFELPSLFLPSMYLALSKPSSSALGLDEWFCPSAWKSFSFPNAAEITLSHTSDNFSLFQPQDNLLTDNWTHVHWDSPITAFSCPLLLLAHLCLGT